MITKYFAQSAKPSMTPSITHQTMCLRRSAAWKKYPAQAHIGS